MTFASPGPGLGEVRVLDHDRPRAMLSRRGDEAADGGPQPPVAGSGGQWREAPGLPANARVAQNPGAGRDQAPELGENG